MALVLALIATGFYLASGAAASYKRMRAAGMPAGGLIQTLRTEAQQKALFLSRYKVQLFGSGPYGDVRWYKGKRYVRYRGLPVAVPGTGLHPKGLAMDVDENSSAHTWLKKHGAYHGWYQPLPISDPVHWQYDVKRDLALKAAKAHAAALAKAKAAAVKKVKTIQGYLGVVKDGEPGPKTNGAWDALCARALRGDKKAIALIKKIQAALGVKKDGVPGPITKAAWVRLVRAAK